MSTTENSEPLKSTTSRIKAVTQKIALAEEKLEAAIANELDAIDKGTRNMDNAVRKFADKHAALYGLLITIAVLIFLVVILILCKDYYSG